MPLGRGWVLPGDWVIRAGEEENPFDSGLEGLPFFMRPKAKSNTAFSDHAIYVLDVSAEHFAIFDPWTGHPVIIQPDLLGGEWYLATENQVKVTWKLAQLVRDRNSSFAIESEMQKFPYRRRIIKRKDKPGRE